MSSSEAQLASFAAGLDAGELPAAVVQTVGVHTFDLIGSIIAGSQMPEAKPVVAFFASLSAGSTPAIGCDAACGALGAVAATAMLSHIAEADPVHSETMTCIAAPVVPAVLLLAAERHLSGKTALAAIVAGYEVTARLGRLVGAAAMFRKGWWPTALCGGIGTAAAVARLFGFSADRIQGAIGLASLNATGLATGAAEAPLSRHVLLGNTARLGAEAALAVEQGIDGPREALVGPRTLTTALSVDNPDATVLSRDLAERWAVLEVGIKAYPCALQAQSALEAFFELRRELNLTAESLQQVDIELADAMLRVVDRPKAPATRLDALASLQYLVAAALFDGHVDVRRSEPEGRGDLRVLATMNKVRVRPAADLDALFPREWPARVTVHREGAGDPVQREIMVPRGNPRKPLSDSEVDEKFDRLVRGRVTAEKRDNLRRMCAGLLALNDVSELVDALLEVAA